MLKPLIIIRSNQTLTISPAISGQTHSFHASRFAHKHAEPISSNEFQRHFQRCVPFQEQKEKIAVAFSGGPDSTCLLYLLKHLTRSNASEDGKLESIVAVTIDHGLQAASSQMTEKCAAIAASLRVKHIVLKIPWGVSPFPAIPSGNSPFENTARKARYHLLLSALREEGVSTIAFGHHADDQVETALLRISRGSAEVGAAGMQVRRLWGMGFGTGPGSLGWAGQHGMSRWIIRPLLRVPKERLVATCQANGLEYVVDKTNFQPDVALRNRIRHLLGDTPSEGLAQGTKALLDMAARVAVSGNGTQQTHDPPQEDGTISLTQLRSAVESISDFVDNLNHEASIQLEKCLRISPASTILLSRDAFSRVTDKSVRLEIIRRVLRFVSPSPWGSPRAEAGRRTASLQRISDALSISGEFLAEDMPGMKFVAGGGVVWTPVHITRVTKMKFTEKESSILHETGWMASRQSPIRRYGDFAANPLELDITLSVLSALSQDSSVEILYDCRFLLHIRPRLFPSDALNALVQIANQRGEISEGQAPARLLIIPHTRYLLPKIVLRQTDAQPKLRSDGDCEPQGQENEREHEHEIARLLPDGSTRTQSGMGENNKDGTRPACNREAVRIKYIRMLDADTSNRNLGHNSA